MRRRGLLLAGSLIAALAVGCDDGGADGAAGGDDAGAGGMGGGGAGAAGGGDGGAGGEGGAGGALPDEATLCEVVDAVFEPTCVACHNGSVDPLDLRSIGLADRIIDAPGLTYPAYQLVVPGDAEASLLYQKAAGTQPGDAGGQMPPGGAVTATQLALLRAWIDGGAEADCATPEPTEVALLGPLDRAVRVSMAVRGVRPSRAELQTLQTDPNALDALVDEWLDSPAFAATVRDMHDAQLKMRAQSGLLFAPAGPLLDLPEASQQVNAINRAVMEAPLELIADVVTHDRPYTEILTADYMPTTAIERALFGEDVMVRNTALGLRCDGGAVEDRPDLTQCRWLEPGRGDAGILSSSAFFLRWQSAAGNLHRGRANAVSTAFLCYDFLSADVSLDGVDIDFADPDVVANAVREIPACATCHEALDPLASFFFGYRGRTLLNQLGDEPYPLLMFNPGQTFQPGRPTRNGRTPALFGQDGATLADLGRLITEHPDFATCTVRRFHGYLAQTGLDALDDAQLTAWAEAFVDSGYDAKALIKRIVLSDAFAVSHAESEVGADAVIGLKKIRPEQAARAVEALTGLEWRAFMPFRINGGTYGDVELPLNGLVGYKVLAGGTDNVSVLSEADSYNAPTAAFWAAFAAEAAGEVVDADFDQPADARRLLRLVEPETREPGRIREQLVALHVQLLGEALAPDDPAIDETLALLSAAAEGNDAHHAWKVVLTAMFQDARFTHY